MALHHDVPEQAQARLFPVPPLWTPNAAQGLKSVVERTLGASREDELLTRAAAKLQGGGSTRGLGTEGRRVSGRRRKSSDDEGIGISSPTDDVGAGEMGLLSVDKPQFVLAQSCLLGS